LALQVPMNTTDISPRSRLVALLFCILLGFLGVHRFYVGKIGTGILMLVTIGGLGIWQLIDLILIAVGSFRDKENRRVFRWTEPGSI
jgi:TM2 domain-containing membrane protein YozV